MGWSAGEMGYNLIRMHIVSGPHSQCGRSSLSGNVVWMYYTLLPEINSAESQYMILWEDTLILAHFNNYQKELLNPYGTCDSAVLKYQSTLVSQHLLPTHYFRGMHTILAILQLPQHCPTQ